MKVTMGVCPIHTQQQNYYIDGQVCFSRCFLLTLSRHERPDNAELLRGINMMAWVCNYSRHQLHTTCNMFWGHICKSSYYTYVAIPFDSILLLFESKISPKAQQTHVYIIIGILEDNVSRRHACVHYM